jgi:hypothetical protein
VLFSQDGHLEATVALLRDVRFWRDEVRVEPPGAHGLGFRKLIEIPAALVEASAEMTLSSGNETLSAGSRP